mgnify:CR=1 FL=1|jgi:hypothetical protein
MRAWISYNTFYFSTIAKDKYVNPGRSGRPCITHKKKHAAREPSQLGQRKMTRIRSLKKEEVFDISGIVGISDSRLINEGGMLGFETEYPQTPCIDLSNLGASS